VKRLQLPSVVQVGAALADVVRRFPWALFMAALGTGSAITMVELAHGADGPPWLAVRLILTAGVGLPLAIAVELLAEAGGLTAVRRRLAELAGVAAAGLYFLSLPGTQELAPEAVYIRAVVLALGLHFVVAFAPVAGRAGEAEFWDFNWRLFLRFWLGALYSAVLYLGLVAAVASASQLFDLKIRGERYGELWFLVVGLFNTGFVLHGTPRPAGRPPEEGAYPRGLSVFAQFALAPLVVVYLAILYPYAGKIIVQRAWPNGWVSLPILCLAVAGILAALFLHPIRQRPDERWAAWYWRWFFRALFPLTVLLYLAVRVRVGEYGVTESRYYGFVLAGWLACVSAHYWWAANRSVRWLPASLAALCLLTTWGPWGAFAVSEGSQLARLEQKLAARGLLAGGVLAPKPQTLDPKEYDDLASMLSYLWSRHDSARLDPLLAKYRTSPGRSAAETRKNARRYAWQEATNVLDWLGVKSGGGAPGVFTVQIDDAPGPIGGYTQAGAVWSLNRFAEPAKAASGGWPRFELDRESGAFVSVTPAGRTKVPAVADALAKALQAPRPGAQPVRIPWAAAAVPVSIEGRDYLLVLLQAGGEHRDDGPTRINYITLLVLAK